MIEEGCHVVGLSEIIGLFDRWVVARPELNVRTQRFSGLDMCRAMK